MIKHFLYLATLLPVLQVPAAAQTTFTDAEIIAIEALVHQNFDNTNAGMVIGLIDSERTRIIAAGKLDNGTDQKVDGDTVFVIGSVTKTFTVLLLQEMVERGQMKLDDPVAKYLPQSVKMPTHNGREIRLLHLAAHDSGLPFDADNLMLENPPGGNIFADYTVEKLYDFLSRHALRRQPGLQYEYSNAGSALLGHVIARKAGADYESLVRERLCRPLGMDSTGITVTTQLKERLATGHEKSGERMPMWDLGEYAPAGAIRSTTNDLLKYLAANLGLSASALTPLMEKTHVILHTNSPGLFPGEMFGNTAMAWMDFGVHQPAGMQLLGHGGGNGGFCAFIGLDKKQRRGVVILSNQPAAVSNPYWLGMRILQRAPLKKDAELAKLSPIRELVGLGAALAIDDKTGSLVITQIVPNSPAETAGLSPGLVVRSINGTDTRGKKLAECLALLRGPAGSKVRLELLGPQNQVSTMELTREKFLTL
jgi:D-alanyl-D-alanine-carboxypeptidase/D-alanyl-D-alanine-endopeptidase